MDGLQSLGDVTAEIFGLPLEGHSVQVSRQMSGLGGGGFVGRGGREGSGAQKPELGGGREGTMSPLIGSSVVSSFLSG